MKHKTEFKTYNDGVVSIYREKRRETGFGARQNAFKLEDMNFIVKLDFEESARREQDFTFAEQTGFSLTLKVRTRFFASVDNKCKAVINNYLYDINYVDKDRKEMWLYLEGVGPLDT